MSNFKFSKCPLCGEDQHIGRQYPPVGDAFLLVTVDTEKGETHTDSGLLVDLYSCGNCGMIFLTNSVAKSKYNPLNK